MHLNLLTRDTVHIRVNQFYLFLITLLKLLIFIINKKATVQQLTPVLPHEISYAAKTTIQTVMMSVMTHTIKKACDVLSFSIFCL